MSIRSKLQGLRDLRGTVADQADRIGDLEREVARLSPQVAALEARVEDLREQLDQPAAGTSAEREEARGIVDDVRREHAQVRARISAATVFEERLRVLEAKAGIESETGRPTR